MGHAVHFLQRLERLSTPQLDLALALYRDSALVRYILARARLPDRAERVALALEDRPDGPHIIVARDGGFVTCLGEGMAVGDHPIITRAQVTHMGERMDSLRAATEQIEGGHATTQRLFAHLRTCGPALSREDFTTLSVMLPLMVSPCLRVTAELTRSVTRFRNGYTRGRYRRLTSKNTDDLRRHWESTWILGHLVALYGSRANDLPDMVVPHKREESRGATHVVAMTALQVMTTPLALRGAWTAARAGRADLPKYKQLVQDSRSMMETMMSGLPLTAIGLRHRGTRAEVRKHVDRCLRKLDDPGWHPLDRVTSQSILEISLRVLDAPDRVEQTHRLVGAQALVDGGKHLPEGHALRFDRPEDVPDDLAFPLIINEESDLYSSVEARILLLYMLPWVARADIAQLYLPADRLDIIRATWRPEVVLAQLEGHHRYHLIGEPIRARPRPGRNEPCSCGSGKKYKRCCGA